MKKCIHRSCIMEMALKLYTSYTIGKKKKKKVIISIFQNNVAMKLLPCKDYISAHISENRL